MSVTEKEIITFLTRYLEAHPRQRGVDLSTLEAQWPVATADLVDLLTSMVAHNTLIKRWDQYTPVDTAAAAEQNHIIAFIRARQTTAPPTWPGVSYSELKTAFPIPEARLHHHLHELEYYALRLYQSKPAHYSLF